MVSVTEFYVGFAPIFCHEQCAWKFWTHLAPLLRRVASRPFFGRTSVFRPFFWPCPFFKNGRSNFHYVQKKVLMNHSMKALCIYTHMFFILWIIVWNPYAFLRICFFILWILVIWISNIYKKCMRFIFIIYRLLILKLNGNYVITNFY